MRAVAIAVGAVSALGRGRAAYRLEAAGEAATSAIARDPQFAAAGLVRPQLARAALTGDGDRATALLGDALEQVTGELDRVLGGWRERRVGVCLGTSSGGMIAAESWFRARREGRADAAMARSASYFAPFDDALARHGLTGARPKSQVVAACASSTIAIGLAMRWLARDACDLVLAGGYDAVGLFVAAGFEAIRATAAALPQPFRLARDGMALGEGAAVLALIREGSEGPSIVSLAGFGASCDSVHITAPDRDGAGLVRAGRAALADAGRDGRAIDLVSAHGTATRYNDAAEAKAIAALCPGDPVVHPFKAQIGHTLGAAGVLELLAAADALDTEVAPAAVGSGAIDPEARVLLLERAEKRSIRAALKLSAAFGGVTAALVIEPSAKRPAIDPVPSMAQDRAINGTTPARSLRAVAVLSHAGIDAFERPALAASLGMPLDRLARIDDLGQLALAAVVALRERAGNDAFAGAGIVGGYALATLDTNERFYSRLLEKGPRLVDPRLFPATSPNAGAGHVAIAFGLTGPSFAMCGGLGGAIVGLLAAAELIAAGDAERMIVVAADDDGPAARDWLELCAPGRRHARGATAVLLGVAPAGAAELVDLDRAVDHDGPAVGHLALRDWLAGPAR